MNLLFGSYPLHGRVHNHTLPLQSSFPNTVISGRVERQRGEGENTFTVGPNLVIPDHPPMNESIVRLLPFTWEGALLHPPATKLIS